LQQIVSLAERGSLPIDFGQFGLQTFKFGNLPAQIRPSPPRENRKPGSDYDDRNQELIKLNFSAAGDPLKKPVRIEQNGHTGDYGHNGDEHEVRAGFAPDIQQFVRIVLGPSRFAQAK